jgi:DNA-binding response OmpR family regulator
MRKRQKAATVVVVGRSLPVLELLETALSRDGHRVLATTRPDEVVELARSIRIDVLVGDRGDALSALADEVRLMQPYVRVVSLCDADELQFARGDGAAVARPVALRELDAAVREAATNSRNGYGRAR